MGSNHINESAVIKQFGLSKDDLENAIIAQKVHWQTRSFYGNSCTRYEYNDIVKYVKELEAEDAVTNSNSNTNTNQKRKLDDAMNDENVMKKRKIVEEEDDDMKEDEFDYTG